MRKTTHKIAGVILAVILCFSLLPMTAWAAADTAVPGETPPTAESAAPDSTAEPVPKSTPSQTVEPTSESTPASSESETTPEPASEPTPQAEKPAVTAVEPELVKTVDGPLVRVEYRYYDESANQNVTDFARYTVRSTHSFYAVAMAAENDSGITVAANKFPGVVQVSTDALRFRVLLNDSEDITSLASYNEESGLVTLPYEYMGHQITIEWYRPASEIMELPLNVTVSSYERGAFSTTVNELFLASAADSFSLPLMAVGAVVSQNGVELPDSALSIADGTVTVAASPLGGEVRIVAYSPQRTRNVGGQVAHTRGSDQIYYGYYTHYFTANGNTAFCLNPSVPSIPSGTYPVSRYLQPGRDDLLIKCGYYLYGGPGYDAVKHNLFENPDSLEAYGLSHAAASYAYSGSSSDAFHGLSSSVRNHLMNVLAAAGAQAMPPQGFEAFVYNEGDSATQSFMGWNYAPTGNLEIVKVSNNPAMTDGNPCYSLEGAVFDVYDGGNSKVGTITTDANGRGRLDGLAAGSGYYLVETRAPKGYAANTQSVPVTIVSGQTVTATVTNVAQGDPVTILLRKQDAERGNNEPQGGGTMAGAQFVIKFYKGLFSESELSGQSPARSWVVTTDEDGFAMLHPDYLVSGDPLYFDSSGRIATLPLGTVTVQETRPPEGYLINPELYLRHITAEGSAEPVYTYNEPVVPDNPIRGGVSVEKWDFDLNRRAVPQGDATLVGAVFEIYNRNPHSVIVDGQTFMPGAVVYTMTTDETGTATTANDLLPYGTYEIIEKTPPTGYLGTGVIRQTFSVTSHGVVVSLKTSATAIKNNVIRGGIEIEKWDIERNARTLKQGDAILAGTVFEIWNRSPRSVVVNGREYGPNQVVHTLTTDADGYAGTANDLLPYGSYEIIEKTPPAGYLNTGVIRQPFQIRENGAVVSLTTDETVIKNNIIRGGVRVEKWDNEIDEHRPQVLLSTRNPCFLANKIP